VLNRRLRKWVEGTIALALGLIAPGCAKTPVAKPAAPQSGSASTSASSMPVPPAAPETAVETAEFQPPYPQRQELFKPPRGDEPAAAQAQPRETVIQLKGFAQAGELKAILRIDGHLTALRVGQAVGTLELVSITPPQVTLRQDGRSWVESLKPPKS
jgi:hypothetical protein